jgi:hypothetical protein
VTQKEAAELLSIEGHEVRVTHPDKPYFSKQAKLSKLDIVRYYLSIAPGALSGIVDRPIVLKRFVNGAEGEAFYQKRAPTDRPAWLRTTTLSFPSGRTAEELVVDNAAGLAWIVNLGCIELHPHPVRSDDLDHPDELRVDLDPGPGESDRLERRARARGSWEAVQQIKRESSGKGLLVGGVKLPLVLAELGLIDEYEFVVQPKLAGVGPTLFEYVQNKVLLTTGWPHSPGSPNESIGPG